MKKQNKFMEFLNSKGFYTAVFTCLFAVLAIAAFVSIRNIDAISKLTTYGEKDQTAMDDYLQPAGIQQERPLSELSAEERSDRINQSVSSTPANESSDSARNVNETEQQPERETETPRTTPQTQTRQAPANTEQKAPDAEVKPSTSADEGEQAKTETPGSSEEEKPEQKEEAKPEAENRPAPNVEEQPTSDVGEENASVTAAVPFDGEDMSWPLDGAVVMDFSDKHAIYDKTLEQYRTNPTVSISAEVGTQVKASADGVVKSVTIDPRTGYTVVIDHGNGWQSTYAQLQETILVQEGQQVAKGHAIGGVGTPTKYGVLLGPHLVFGITKDEAPQNPNVVLASGE